MKSRIVFPKPSFVSVVPTAPRFVCESSAGHGGTATCMTANREDTNHQEDDLLAAEANKEASPGMNTQFRYDPNNSSSRIHLQSSPTRGQPPRSASRDPFHSDTAHKKTQGPEQRRECTYLVPSAGNCPWPPEETPATQACEREQGM
jgi:hypothetical protein